MKVKNIFTSTLLVLILLGFASCQWINPIEDHTPYYDDNEKQIGAYIDDAEDLSELSSILTYTGLNGLMNFYGTYTFAPTDEAFFKFYAENGKTSYTDFDKEELTEIIRNHILQKRVLTTTTGEGNLPDTTMAGNYIVVTIETTETELGYFLNKKSQIIKRDIELPNGVVQIVDEVIDIVDYSVAGWVINNREEFSIFAQALEETKLDSVLSERKKVFQDGLVAKNYFTLWAVPDAAYHAAGIMSFEQLASENNANGNPYSSPSSDFYQYMLYHCLKNSISLSSFDREPTQLVSLSNLLFQIEIDPDDAIFKINKEENGDYVGIDNDASNNNAYNGYIHVLTTPLALIDFKPVERIIHVCDKPGIPYEDMKVLGTARVDIPSASDEYLELDQVEGIRWHPEAQCKIDNHLVAGGERLPYLVFSVKDNPNNILWYEFDLPPITKGIYTVSIICKPSVGYGRAVVQSYLNDEKFGGILDMRTRYNILPPIEFGAFEITSPNGNVLKMKELVSGVHLICAIVLTPIEQ